MSVPDLGHRLGACLILALLPFQSTQRGVIRGAVTDPDGYGLAGARVIAFSVVDGRVTRPGWGTHTAADGTYELSVRPGVQELRVELDGFCGAGRRRVQIAEGQTRAIHYTLRLSPVEEVIWVEFPLPEALARADAAVHMRITRSHPPRLMIPDVSCGDGNVFTEHEFEVLSAIKTGERWPNAERVLFVQPRAGVYHEDHTLVQGPRTPYAVGEEYVAFLHWSPDEQRFVSSAAPNAMIPVRDGRIVWQGAAEEGVHDGMPVEAFLDRLRELRR